MKRLKENLAGARRHCLRTC